MEFVSTDSGQVLLMRFPRRPIDVHSTIDTARPQHLKLYATTRTSRDGKAEMNIRLAIQLVGLVLGALVLTLLVVPFLFPNNSREDTASTAVAITDDTSQEANNDPEMPFSTGTIEDDTSRNVKNDPEMPVETETIEDDIPVVEQPKSRFRPAGPGRTEAESGVAEICVEPRVLPEPPTQAGEQEWELIEVLSADHGFNRLDLLGLDQLDKALNQNVVDPKSHEKAVALRKNPSLTVRVEKKEPPLCEFRLVAGGVEFRWHYQQEKRYLKCQKALEVCVLELSNQVRIDHRRPLSLCSVQGRARFPFDKTNATIPQGLLPHHAAVSYDVFLEDGTVFIDGLGETKDKKMKLPFRSEDHKTADLSDKFAEQLRLDKVRLSLHEKSQLEIEWSPSAESFGELIEVAEGRLDGLIIKLTACNTMYQSGVTIKVWNRVCRALFDEIGADPNDYKVNPGSIEFKKEVEDSWKRLRDTAISERKRRENRVEDLKDRRWAAGEVRGKLEKLRIEVSVGLYRKVGGFRVYLTQPAMTE